MIKDLFVLNKQYEILADSFSLLKLSNTEKYGIFFNNSIWEPNKNYIQTEQSFSNLDFANIDFNNFLKDIKWYSIVGKISQSSKYHISNIKINKSFIDPYKLYINKIILLTTVFTFQNKTPYLSFADYISAFSAFILKEKINVTYSNHFCDKSISIQSSGLVYSLLKENNNSIQTAKDYILDSNFLIFQEICTKNNFIIDRYMPWIIIRKLTTNDISANAYKYDNVYSKDIESLYNGLKQAYIYYTTNLIDKKLKDQVNTTNFDVRKHQLLDFFISMKLNEKNQTFTKEQIARVKDLFILNSIKNSIQDSVIKLETIRFNTDNSISTTNSSSLYL